MVKGSKRKRDPVISVKKCSKRNNKNGKIESQGYGYGSSVCDSEFMGSLAADLPRVSGKLCMWVDVLKLMSKLTSYKDLVAFCANLEFPPLPEKFSGRIIEGIYFVDRISAGLMHHCDVPFHCVPLQTVADGNCFCRALSKFVFNTEAQHGQIRVRLVADAVKNEDSYLKNECLRIGGCQSCEDINLVQNYCTYNDHYNPVMKLNKQTFQKLYRKEWFDYRLLSCYSGLLQLHSAANSLQIKLVSHYPDRVIESIYTDTNRSMFPLGCKGTERLRTCHILWTTANGRSHLNHFVPLIEKKRKQCKHMPFLLI